MKTSVSTDKKLIERILTKAVEQVIPSKKALEELLYSGKRIKIYQGFDPTGPTLHIGHTVMMRKLEDFRKLGHEVIFLIGDFTARIGDPTDKSSSRKKLTKEQVEENLRCYKEQASKIIDIDNKENPVTIMYNSSWHDKMTFADVVELASEVTVQQMLERDMFQKRIKEERPIYLNEFLYPIMQGWDSVVMGVDIEVGGNDQLFNMLVGRELVRNHLKKDKIVITGKLLTTDEGVKMGKSEGNMIMLSDSAKDIYGKVMAFSDEQIISGFELLTNMEMDEVNEMAELMNNKETNPMVLKKKLAWQLVSEIKSREEADDAQMFFESVFQKRDLNDANIPVVTVNSEAENLINLLVDYGKIAKSRGEAKRLIEQGAVSVNSEKVKDINASFSLSSEALTIKAGKQVVKFVKGS